MSGKSLKDDQLESYWLKHCKTINVWLVVSTHLKNISQNGNLPQIGVENKKCLKPPPRLPVTPNLRSYDGCL